MAQHDAALPPTERRNPRTENLEELSTEELLRRLHDEDHRAVSAVDAVLPDLAVVVDRAAERFRRGGDVHYFGAGTSGRLGVLDASELLPTFNLPPGRVVGHIAGGPRALQEAVEDAEDSFDDGAAAVAELGADDVVIGLTASGSTPYVGGALATARDRGLATVLISSNPEAPLRAHADHHLCLDTGPEAITGSTRLKAGTAQKLVLNAFSTALMVAVGRTWSNLMVSMVATNAKLRERTVRILREATGLEEPAARRTLAQAEGDLKTALLMALSSLDADQSARLLHEHDGSVRDALRADEKPATLREQGRT
ncbi:N-acetylmuramic acid 6-phosphate etherase [Nesterenkonia sp. HG001]|uniref:N-acetylmuramic acid 6-phosphate etherase n=1 Tax=Nesterenkonia sp. HG001 TaxID=2983207 RepID=UPI002AC3E473|nr:N-acetylmuramic acid 6-phosphate etherase [Nesterenkonia sp. HG001]MDZ5077993.1 N-acetylmuramic acid 6-phosphate etherase [Nesterenkonia sp. HG001]